MIKTIVYCVFVSIGLWIGWMATDNVHPYEYDLAESRMVPDPFPRSSAMIVASWGVSKVNKICPGTSQRFFRDLDKNEMFATLDTTELSRAMRPGDDRLPRGFLAPPNLPKHVGYSALICSECNLFQKFIKPLCFMTPEIEFRTTD